MTLITYQLANMKITCYFRDESVGEIILEGREERGHGLSKRREEVLDSNHISVSEHENNLLL